MLTILCILLYLTVIFSPGTYTTTQIHNLEQQNHTQVQAVQQNPTLIQQVQTTYIEDAQRVKVVNEYD
jgi:predicted PurR-regulated permease PerM